MSTSCSALTWALYDYLVTLDDEITFVWKRPIRGSAILFLIMRYLSLAVLCVPVAAYLFLKTGQTITYPVEFDAGVAEITTYAFVRIPQLVVFWLVEVILQTRIFAVYGSRQLAVFNAVMFMFEVIAMIVLSIFNFGSGLGSSRPIYIIPGLAFELWLAGLAAAKFRFRVCTWQLARVIIADSIIYFALLAVAILLYFIAGNLTVSSLYQLDYSLDDPTLDLDNLVFPFMVASQSIGASRLFLHLRKKYHKQRESSSGIHGTSEMVFQTASVQQPQHRGFIASIVDEAFYEPSPEAQNTTRLVPITSERA